MSIKMTAGVLVAGAVSALVLMPAQAHAQRGLAGGIAGGILGGPAGSAIGGALGGAFGGAGGEQGAQFQQALGQAAMSFAQDMFGELQEAFGDTDEEE